MRYQFTTFMKDPDADRPDNPIHSTTGGREHGFRGALVGGIHVYGWTTGAFLDELGDEWLDHGWVEVAFRKPTYDGDVMTVNLNSGDFTVTNPASDVCLQGKAGLGDAPWLHDITRTSWCEPQAEVASRPALTLENAPRGRDLLPMAVPWSAEAQEAFIAETLRDDNPHYHGRGARCHPAWLAGRLIYLLHHSYEYGPAIHTESHIQNLLRAPVDQTFTVTGHCHDAFEKRGHHYIVNDGSIWSEEKEEVVRLRHTAIFKLRSA